MSDEGKEPVVEEIQPNADGKYPETIPYSKYVGIKEAWGKSKEKVANLEEKLHKAVNAEEVDKIKQELVDTKADRDKIKSELDGTKLKSATEKRELLVKRGLSEEKVKDLSDEALTQLVDAIGDIVVKPKPDMSGGGGGGSPLTGSPSQLARQAYANTKK